MRENFPTRKILGKIKLQSFKKNYYLACMACMGNAGMQPMGESISETDVIASRPSDKIETMWALWMISSDVILLQSMRRKGGYLHRGDLQRGVTMISQEDEKSEWFVEIVEWSPSPKVKLMSWKGDYLYSDGHQKITTWLPTDASQWIIEFIEITEKGKQFFQKNKEKREIDD